MKQTNQAKPMLLSRTKPLSLIIICVLIGILPLISSANYIIRLGSLVMCYSLLAISIDLLTGYMGLSAYGNAGFFGLAAYIVGWFSQNTKLSFITVFIIAVLSTALVSYLFGFICRSIWGTTFLIVNLALGQCIWGLAFRLTRITGADMGIPGIMRPESILGFKMINNTNYYYFIFIIFAVVVFLIYRLVNSPFGLTIHGIRQSRKRMSALGFNVIRHKHITYVISGTVAGIGGILYVYLVNFVSPDITNTLMMSKAFLMSLVGGIGTISGGIIGAMIIVITENLISSFTQRWVMILGLLYIFTAVVCPKGIVGLMRTAKEKIVIKISERKKTEADKRNN